MTPEEADAARFAEMALASVHREYPSHLVHLLGSAADVRAPRELTPAFWGSFDWHSSVHTHWALARLARCFPSAPFAGPARAALDVSLTPEHIAGEVAYMGAAGREGFERPYGLAWLLQLAAELREWEDSDARRWHGALVPLEQLAARRLSVWLPRLRWPVRSGEHGQTAFALGLALDWARTAGDREFEELIKSRAHHYYAGDRAAPMDYEPSGHDFLSPILGEADLMRRVLPPDAYREWLARLLPDLGSAAAVRWLTPVVATDRADGKLAHLDGLNLSRAWMLDGVARALPTQDPARAEWDAAALRHRVTGVAGATGEHYAGSHWLGSFASYLITARGIANEA